MTIKIDWTTVAVVGVIAATAAIAVVAARGQQKREEEFQNHKKEKIGDRDLWDEVNDTTIENEKIESSEDRKEAFKALENAYYKVKSTKTIETFDKAFDNFNRMVNGFTNGSREEILSRILIYKERDEKERKEAERRAFRSFESEKEKARNSAKLEQAKIISNAIKSAGNIAFATSDYAKKRATKDALEDIANFTINITK